MMATTSNGVVQEEENISDVSDTFIQLQSALDRLRAEEFVYDRDVMFLQTLVKDPHFSALCEVNDKVANSQSLDQPEGSAEEPVKALEAKSPCNTDEESELLQLLRSPFISSLLRVHDTVRSRSYDPPIPDFDPTFHPKTNYQRHQHGKRGGSHDYRTVGLHKSANEPLGITLKLLGNKLIIARILFGGLIHRQGLLQVGDRIVEVNNESVDHLNPSDLQTMLKNSSGSIVMKIDPGFRESTGATELFLRAHFNYEPKQDMLIPSQEAGLPFSKGDILKVLNQEDSFWWQAIRFGEYHVAGLIPSQMLEERRKAYGSLDGLGVAGCLGRKKQKKKIMYSSHHSGEFETYDLILYEPVSMVENFQYRCLVLIGAPNIGRRSLKTRLMNEYAAKFAEVRAHTTRDPRTDEDRSSFYFVSEEHMRADIMAHKFLEFGKHQHHLYGIKAETVSDVISTGKMAVLDVHPQALKLLRTPQFRPLVVFIKAASPEGVRRLHHSAKVDNPGGHTTLTDEDFIKCAKESARIEKLYSHYFDTTIVNENIDVAYDELLVNIRHFSTGKHWVPANWVM